MPWFLARMIELLDELERRTGTRPPLEWTFYPEAPAETSWRLRADGGEWFAASGEAVLVAALRACGVDAQERAR